VGVVGGSDLKKINGQLCGKGGDRSRVACILRKSNIMLCLSTCVSVAVLFESLLPPPPTFHTSARAMHTASGLHRAVFDMFDYTFSENGLMAHKGAELLAVQSLKKFLGEDKLKRFINFVLHYIADLDIPIKRGTFVEFRNGMLNISPIGRNCSQEERDDFEQFDETAGVRRAHPCSTRGLEVKRMHDMCRFV
jgi:hypothetical protein